ncbi:MAG: hypothetical protein ACRD2J_09665 [Thermoanaerobaculia bacterium]
MRIAVLTPLPPVRSGIAGYARLLLPHLARRVELVAVCDQPEVEPLDGVEVLDVAAFAARRDSFDAVVGQLGNNPYHDFVWDEAVARPIHVVLHDAVLHHLVVERTLAKGNAEEYERLARESDGPAAAAFARGRAMGLDLELGNFLFPLAAGVAERSRGVVVHNRWAGEQLRERGVTVPIVVAGHPFDERVAPPSPAEREATRARLGFAPGDRVVGVFGFVTGAKRPEVVFEAVARAAEIDPTLRLLVVGEPAPNVELAGLALRAGLPRESWKALGYVDDSAFDRLLASVDRVVNLRYPSAGEMSGPLVRALQFGIPVAVSGIAQFAEIPREVVVPIPLTDQEVPALVSFMTRPIDAAVVAAAQRQWLDEHGAMDRVVAAYLRALEGGNDVPLPRRLTMSALPLATDFEVEHLEAAQREDGVAVRFVVRNRGAAVWRAAAWGEPAPRLVVKVFDADIPFADRWVAPAGDVAPGEAWEDEVAIGGRPGAGSVTLTPALSETPDLPREPLASVRLR